MIGFWNDRKLLSLQPKSTFVNSETRLELCEDYAYINIIELEYIYHIYQQENAALFYPLPLI